MCLITRHFTIEKNYGFRHILNWSNLHLQQHWSHVFTASNYKSSTSYFNQLDQQADGICFWPTTSVSFMNPRVLSPSTNQGEPRTTATNQKCTLTQNLKHCSHSDWAPVSNHQLGFGKATITIGAMWIDSGLCLWKYICNICFVIKWWWKKSNFRFTIKLSTCSYVTNWQGMITEINQT